MKRIKTMLCLFVVCVLALPAAARSQSQATTAEINGRVTDAQGGALPGVTVTATAPATGYTRTVVTNEEGLYAIPLLPPGQYDLTIELAGFGATKRVVPLTVGATVTVNPQLQVAGVTETVTVEATSPIVETSATIRTTTVNADAISNLPINGRRFQDFATLTPGVQVDTSRGQLSFAGQRGINSNVSVDGADYNQPFFGGIRGGERSNNAFTVPQESVQEFQVVAAGYSAEFGRSTGGLMNVITKSGTNDLNGSGFYVNRNREWAERNAFGQQAAPTQHQFGGSIGGPITRDRLFFFGAYEQQEFSNERGVAFNLTGVSPTSGQEAYDFFRSQETDFEATNDAKAVLGKVDYQVASGSRFSVRYSYSKNRALNSNATGNALEATTTSALSNNGTENDETNTIVGQYTSAIRSNLLVEARAQYSREERPREANDPTSPTVSSSIGNFGTVSFLPTTQFDWRTQAAANVTALVGTHSFKFGTEYNHVFVEQSFGFNQFGAFNISASAANALDVLSVGGVIPNRFDVPGTGATSTATYLRQLGNLQTNFSTDEIAFFANDSWKLRPNFTLNYGLRWEGTFNPTPDANNDFIVNAVRGFTFPNGRQVDPTQISDQLNQWGPRVGFAWDPTGDGQTVVRGYSGLYYARTPSLIYADPMNTFRNPPGNLSVQLPFTVPAGNPNNTLYRQFLLIGIDLNQTPLSSLPVLTPAQITQIATALGLTPNPFVGAQPLAVDTEFRNPRATQAGFGVEREVVRDMTVGADFTYVKTDFLQRNLDMNLGIPTPRPTDPAQRPIFPAARPLAALGSVQVRESTARSEYTALTLTNRLTKAWGQVQVNYVLSKSMSDDDNERDSGGMQFENQFNLEPEWSPARLDRRHQFNGLVVFNLPANFGVSSGFRFLSALPIDATMGRDINGSRGGADRPFSGPNQPFQRNAFRNEPFKEVNLRGQWGLGFNNGNRVMVTAELFNLFNWDNLQLAGTAVTNYCAGTAPDDCGFSAPTNPNFLSLVDNITTSSTFGQLIRTNNPGAPRQIQLGVRFEF